MCFTVDSCGSFSVSLRLEPLSFILFVKANAPFPTELFYGWNQTSQTYCCVTQRWPRLHGKVLYFWIPLHLWRWVLGGGVGVPCTANPLHGGLTAEAEASKAAWTLLSETVTIRPLRLAVSERFRRVTVFRVNQANLARLGREQPKFGRSAHKGVRVRA